MKIIYLEPDEEITSVVDQLAQAEESEVALVVPIGAQLLQSLVNLKLLKREANNLEKNVVIVTADELGRQLAPKANFVVIDKLDQIEITASKETAVVSLAGQKTENGEKDILDALAEELEPDFYKSESEGGPKAELAADKRMVDIVGPREKSKSKFSPGNFFKKFIEPTSKPFRKRNINQFEAKPIIEPGLNIEKEDILDEERFKEKTKPASRRLKFFYVFIGLALLVAALAAYLILPNTEIIISPKTENIAFDLEVSGSKKISKMDAALNEIPVQLIKVEKTLSKEFKATGEKQLSEKAKGVITIYNEYSSSPQTLVATTRFISEAGKLFRITKNIIVPGAKIEEGRIIASAVDAEVEADDSGEEYNVGPSNFTIPGFKDTPKYAGFYANSKAPMTGGLIGKVNVVSEEDLKKAEEVVVNELKIKAQEDLKEQMPNGLKLIEGAIDEEITETSSNPGLENQAENFTYKAAIVLQALLFNEEDLKILVDANLTSKISQDKIPLSNTQQIVWEKPVIDWDKTKVSFTLRVSEEAAFKIETEALKKDLAGLNEVEVRKFLANRLEIEKAKVTFWPFWVKRVPLQASKIKIKLD